MLFDFKEIPGKECYKLLVSTVTPRPIAWVVSQDANGVLNAAPFSFFNVFSGDPAVVAIGIGNRKPGQAKDSRANIRETGEFVVNLVSEANAEAMNITGIEFDSTVDELEQAGLTSLPSARVKPPRIAESPVAMECELMQIVDLGESGLVLGRVVAMHVRDDLVLDAANHYIDTPQKSRARRPLSLGAAGISAARRKSNKKVALSGRPGQYATWRLLENGRSN